MAAVPAGRLQTVGQAQQPEKGAEPDGEWKARLLSGRVALRIAEIGLAGEPGRTYGAEAAYSATGSLQ